jgi:hypothetical protein
MMMVSGTEEGQGFHLNCLIRYKPNLVLGGVVIELIAVQSIEEDL